ncbi:MAG TPA: hypothetical protein VGC22_04505 [Chitinophaga sp.]
MKKILIASFIVGAAAAGVILFLTKNTDLLDEAEDAADQARSKMNRHARKVSRAAKNVLNGAVN